jgi:hypothetical protein
MSGVNTFNQHSEHFGENDLKFIPNVTKTRRYFPRLCSHTFNHDWLDETGTTRKQRKAGTILQRMKCYSQIDMQKA